MAQKLVFLIEEKKMDRNMRKFSSYSKSVLYKIPDTLDFYQINQRGYIKKVTWFKQGGYLQKATLFKQGDMV